MLGLTTLRKTNEVLEAEVAKMRDDIRRLQDQVDSLNAQIAGLRQPQPVAPWTPAYPSIPPVWCGNNAPTLVTFKLDGQDCTYTKGALPWPQ